MKSVGKAISGIGADLLEKTVGPANEDRHNTTVLFCSRENRFQKVKERIALRSGFSVSAAYDGEEALWILRKHLSRAEIGRLAIVTEFTLPLRTGLELCQFVRSHPRLSEASVLIVAEEGDSQQCIDLLESGADDCLREPVGPREIESRIVALLRRSERKAGVRGHWPFERVEIEGLVVDTARFEVSHNGQEIQLSYKEFTVLVLFLSRPGRALSYDEILSFVWGEHSDRRRENLKVLVHALRKKISGAPFIEAIRGFGYRMRDSPPIV
jgi:two-component system alkaline phosphatase synthesis response regulator PhoP